jgi:multidrug transporter EmrE-like cation transporter
VTAGTYLLLAADMAANTGSHICFKLSAGRRGVKRFLFWQVVGNLAAFAGVIAFTFLLKSWPLHTAYPVTEGLTAIGVQLLGSMLLMKERITPLAWVGTGLILCGVVLFSL